jgi:2,4-dienoyl-CoA reductase-like NADH-dependent reductase (Old Yellow Enzyme family)/thioredoxin reductase
MALTHVLTPIRLGPIDVRNRVVRTAHGTRLAMYSFDELAEFHAARARGGVGLSILEILGVHPTSPASLRVFDPAHDAGYRRMMPQLKPLGMKVFQQLWHGGHHVMPVDGSPCWSASDIPSPLLGVVPLVMTKAMIDEIVEAYAKSARQCEEWGLDGVELHAAHSYLPQQFLSTLTNRRDDDYGGSFDNRARFTLEILEAIRSMVSKEFAISVRVGPDDTPNGVGGGATVEDNIRLVAMIEERGLADVINISLGGYYAFDKMLAGMYYGAGYELPTSVPIARSTRLPTVVIGRFRTLEEADQIIRSGDADMVAMTRAHIADPDIVRKTVAGHPEQVRPCIGCNQGCLAGVLGPNQRIGCTVNPGVSYEATLAEDTWQEAISAKRVLVVGGGPAGMEAARVARLRGHDVTLVEASNALGGAVNVAAKVPNRHGIRDLTVWLEQEVYRLGVDVRLSTYFEAEDILGFGADTVIVATGSTPRMDGIQIQNPGDPIVGIALPHVLSSHDLLTGPSRPLGSRAVVIDDVGHYEGIAASEYLLEKGVGVAYVTRHGALAPLLETAATPEPALRRMYSDRFEMHLRTRAVTITSKTVTIAPTYLPKDTNHARTIEADTVVFISQNRPNREIYDDLKRLGIDIRIVGDARTPRFLPVAMMEARLAGVEV